MPYRPLRPCTYPGCRELADGGRCVKHRRHEGRDYDQRRGSSTARGYDYKWQRYRVQYLREHPLCECDDCKRMGRIVPAKDVDHIVAVSGPDDPLFWEPSNHRAMAHGHHSRKTVREDGGFGRG